MLEHISLHHSEEADNISDSWCRVLLWRFMIQSSTQANLFRDGDLRAGGGLLSLQTDDMVTEHGNELYHSNHLLPWDNVMVNQYTIHLRRAKPNTCHSKLIFRMGLAI